MLPPIVFAQVAVSLCPSALLAHVALECPSRTRNLCIQQYPPGGVAAVRLATLVMRAVTFATSAALASVRDCRVVRSAVAAAAMSSRYPSSRAKVLSVRFTLSSVSMALAVEVSMAVPEARSWPFWAMWAAR
eukprot:CCRYP_014018-RA/>CCRYP_014018-RA protein AED:0.40 eAED:0.70 QI:135/0/0.5/1/0/0/2/0/131